MKYAIIYVTHKGSNTYLKGFTNTPFREESKYGVTYTKELKELSSLFVRLEGDAEQYLS